MRGYTWTRASHELAPLIVHDGSLYFGTDDGQPATVHRSGPASLHAQFRPLKRYLEVPADVLEGPDELLQWARRARLTR